MNTTNESILTEETLPQDTTAEPAPWWIPQTTPMSMEEWHQRFYTTIAYIFFAIVGLIVNGIPITLTFTTQLRENLVNIMIANLLLSNFLLSFGAAFFQPLFIMDREHISYVFCGVLAWYSPIAVIFDFLFPPLLSINRYVSLFHSHLYDRLFNKKSVVVMVIGTWTVSGTVSLVYYLGGQVGFDDDNLHCCIVVKHANWMWRLSYWVIVIVPLIFFTIGVMAFCSYKIYKKLVEHGAGAKTLSTNVVKQHKEILYFVLLDVACPIIWHTTFQIARLTYVNRHSMFGRRIFYILCLSNSCMRGFITVILLRPYRNALKKLRPCKYNTTVAPSMTVSGTQNGQRGTISSNLNVTTETGFSQSHINMHSSMSKRRDITEVKM